MRIHDISFEEANLLIEKQVNELKTSLSSANRYFLVIWASFGLTTKDIMYSHPIKFIRPEYFGLSQVSLKPIIQMQPAASTARKETRRLQATRHIGIASAVAAVIAAIIFLITPFDKKYSCIAKVQIFCRKVYFLRIIRRKPSANLFPTCFGKTKIQHLPYPITKPRTTESSAEQESVSEVKPETKYYMFGSLRTSFRCRIHRTSH
jgi:hypothetical protein